MLSYEKFVNLPPNEKDKIYSDLLEKEHNYESVYGRNEKGEITKFYSKIAAHRVLMNYKVINISGDYRNNLLYTNGCYVGEASRDIIEFGEDNKISFNELTNYIWGKIIHPMDSNANKNVIETLKAIAMETRTPISKINIGDRYINFKNCILDTMTWKTIKHTPDIIFTSKVQANYNSDKTDISGTLFEKYLLSSLGPDFINLIQEIIGYIFSDSMAAQKFFVLTGSGSNGKSIFLNIIKEFYTEYSASTLQQLEKQEFVADLLGKKLNISGDIDSSYIENTALLKQLIGQDSVSARFLHGNPFKFINKAKLFFSCNKIPQTSDKTNGFIRRLVIIPFNKKIEESNKIIDLDKKIIEKEIDIIVSWAIEGLKRLQSNNFVFSDNKEVKEVMKLYKDNNNSVIEFLNTFTINDSCKFIPKTEFKDLYEAWCKSERLQPLGRNAMNQTLLEYGIREGKNNKASYRYWNNIEWALDIKEVNGSYRFVNEPTLIKVDSEFDNEQNLIDEQEGKQESDNIITLFG